MRSKRRVTLIHNRSAGEADHDERELARSIKAAGFELAYFDAKTCDIARVVADPGDLIAVAGGDGTVRKVALAARPDGPPIAILPLGTANNIAHSLGITASIQSLITGWQHPALSKFYPIEVEAPWGRHRLIEGIGFGVLAQVIEESADNDKLSPLEARERIAERMLRAQPEEFDIRIDDARVSESVVLLEIMTIRLVGPNLHLAPDANPADQLVDLCWVSADDRLLFTEWLQAPGSDAPAPVPTRSAHHIAISGRLDRVRLDDMVRPGDAAERCTITVGSAAEPLYFVVPA